MKKILGLFIVILLVIGCNQDGEKANREALNKPLLELLSFNETGVAFENTITESVQNNIATFDYFFNGGGVAIGDINNDGLEDILLTGNQVANKLFLNKGNFKFEDISVSSGISKFQGWSTGARFCDVNNDGNLDIYICNSGPSEQLSEKANFLFVNQGNLNFKEEAKQYGIADQGNSMQSTFFDYDKDGDEDLFVMNHTKLVTNTLKFHDWIKTIPPDEYERYSNTLYRNDGSSFSDVTKAAGVLKPGFGLGLVSSDLNHDGWVDLYVANDYFIPDFMYINQGNGTFIDQVRASTGHTSFYSMGCDAADFNNDGLLDLGIVDMTPSDHVRSKRLMPSMNVSEFRYLVDKNYQPQYMFNVLQLNQGFGVFSEISQFAGTSKTDWSWASLFMDLDNDGLKDYIITNGFLKDTKDNDMVAQGKKIAKEKDRKMTAEEVFEYMQQYRSTPLPNYIFQNIGQLKFEDKSKQWGFNEPSFSNGAAYADLDNDGDIDLVINNINSNAFVYRNNATEQKRGNFLQVDLVNTNKRQSVANSKVYLHANGNQQLVEIGSTRGYQSSMPSIAHFGLGSISEVEKLVIEWPDGSETTFENPEINKRHTIDKSKSERVNQSPSDQQYPFGDFTAQSGIDFVHKENPFDDYLKEILLPHSQSRLGPFSAIGDANGDGFDDIFIGGAKGQAGKLYLQYPQTGKFITGNSQPWIAHADREDMGCTFFDLENDGDLDLYIASGGGGDVEGQQSALKDRLYINDGQAGFKDVSSSLPTRSVSSGRVIPADFNSDGKMDLFVAGRTSPGSYPKPTSSYLLQNEGGKLVDVTKEKAPDFENLGMVTDAVWLDFNQDNQKDIILVGEWMSIRMFAQTGGVFEEVSTQYLPENLEGWWYSILAEDMDGDGDKDLIVGNLGKNNKFKARPEKPLNVFLNDFDENGVQDIVLSKKYKNSLVPVRGKECSTQQMPFVSEKFPTFKGFAEATLEDIYGKEKLDEAIHYQAKTFESVYIENTGSEGWKVRPLPNAAQLFPINGIVAKDFDGNGFPDLILGGNNFDTEVETGAYDAGKGLFLKNLGNGNFEVFFKVTESGLLLKHNLKDIQLLSVSPQKLPAILVTNNNFTPQFYIFIEQNMK